MKNSSDWARRYRRLRARLRVLRNIWHDPGRANRIPKRTDFSSCERPVLLVYGFFATRRSFQVMERRLRRDGYCVFSIDLGGLKGAFNNRSIPELAELVAAKVERLYTRYRLGPLTIIGHSKGGLIGAHYVKHLGGARRVRTLITVGTPHNGTPLAILGLLIAPMARSVLQMLPGSPFLKRLRKTPMPREVWYASIWSKKDRTCPHPAAILQEDGENVVNTEVEPPHFELLTRQSVYERVRQHLAAGEAWSLGLGRVRLQPREEREGVALLGRDGTLGLPI
jgi:triacylglycerol esterase/lipase EstA (alpha/beta hydrolase family)